MSNFQVRRSPRGSQVASARAMHATPRIPAHTCARARSPRLRPLPAHPPTDPLYTSSTDVSRRPVSSQTSVSLASWSLLPPSLRRSPSPTSQASTRSSVSGRTLIGRACARWDESVVVNGADRRGLPPSRSQFPTNQSSTTQPNQASGHRCSLDSLVPWPAVARGSSRARLGGFSQRHPSLETHPHRLTTSAPS